LVPTADNAAPELALKIERVSPWGMHDISDRQRRILAAIRDHIAETGEAPTVREIGTAVGLSSSSSVLYQLRRLEQAGMLTRDSFRVRSIRLP